MQYNLLEFEELLVGLSEEAKSLVKRLEQCYDAQLFPDFRLKVMLVRARRRSRRRQVRALRILEWY